MKCFMRIMVSSMIFLSFVLMLTGQPAQWQENGIAVRQGVNIEWNRAATALDNGSVIYVWSDTRYGGRDLWAQAVNEDGVVWEQSLLVDGKPDRQEDPVVIKTSDGYAIIAWVDFFDDTIDGDIYAQKISPAGELMWETSIPLTLAEDIQISLNIVPNEEGGAYIIWLDQRSGSSIDIYGVHIDGNGDNYDGWTEGGLPLASGDGNQISHTFWEDGQNGAILAYINSYDGQDDIYVNRILPNGQIAWSTVLVEGPQEHGSIKVSPFGDNAFGFAYTDRANNYRNIYLNVLDMDGDFVWAEPLPINVATYDQLNPRVVSASDNNFIVVWEDFRSGVSDLYVQKVDINGNFLWQDNGVPVVINELEQKNPRMESDGNGGCLIVWDDAREGGHPNIDVYMQHLSSEGNILWTENGHPAAQIPGEAFGPLLKVAGEHIFVSWGDMRTGSVGIYAQGFDFDAVPLFVDNGIQIFWGLSGDTLDQKLVHNGDYIYIVWQDTRYANFGSQIKVQKVDADGQIYFAENGISITNHSGADQVELSVVPHHSGGVAIAWAEQRGDYVLAYTQAIDPDGNKLWGDLGLRVSTVDLFYPQASPIISRDGDSYIVVWDETNQEDFSYARNIVAQKIVDGARVWDDEGVTIAWQDEGPYVVDHFIQEVIDGKYIVWLKGDGQQAVIYAKLIDENGEAAEGWDEYGLVVCQESTGVQRFTESMLTDEGLLVLWVDSRYDPNAEDPIQNASIYGQLIDEDGEILWRDNGMAIADYDNDQSHIDALYEDGFAYLVWRDARVSPASQDVAAQKISMDGRVEWGEPSPFVISNEIVQENPQLYKHGNKVLFAWENNYGELGSNLHMQLADYATGNLEWATEGEILCNAYKRQFDVKLSAFDVRYSFACWIDGRSSGKEEIKGLYAQKIDTNGVSNINTNINAPVGRVHLHSNYPNPFNPVTNIAFDLNRNETVSLKVYNLKGQLVKTLVNKDYLEKGNHIYIWNGIDNQDKQVSSGVYFYKLEGENHSQTKKMLLLK